MKKYYKKIIFGIIVGTIIFCNITTNGQNVPQNIPTNGLIGWWPFNGNANDLSGNGLNGNVIGATLTNDRNNIINAAYNFNYNNVSFGNQNNEIYIPYSPILNVSAITISLWVYQRQYYWSGNSNPPISTFIARFQNGYSTPNGEVWMVNSGSNGFSAFANASALTLNTWYHILSTYEGNVGKIYINGILMNTLTNSTGLNINGNSGISIGESNQANGFWWPTDGKIDDIGIWNRALTQKEITTIYTGCNLTFSLQPTNQNVIAGSNTILTVSTIDTNSTYQWQSKIGLAFQNITNTGQFTGANNDTLFISNTTVANNGQLFRCIIMSETCSDTSNTVSLTSCPVIAIQPTNQNVNIGNSAYFINNYSDPNSSYNWQTDIGFGFQNITNAGQYTGANNDTLTILNSSIANNNQIFRCIVTSGSCKDTSDIATLTVGNIGINELNNKQQIVIYPNPASNEINVKTFHVNIGANYTITDNLGRIVKQGILNSESSIIELGNLSGGVYMFRIGNNVNQFFKIMKTN